MSDKEILVPRETLERTNRLVNDLARAAKALARGESMNGGLFPCKFAERWDKEVVAWLPARIDKARERDKAEIERLEKSRETWMVQHDQKMTSRDHYRAKFIDLRRDFTTMEKDRDFYRFEWESACERVRAAQQAESEARAEATKLWARVEIVEAEEAITAGLLDDAKTQAAIDAEQIRGDAETIRGLRLRIDGELVPMHKLANANTSKAIEQRDEAYAANRDLADQLSKLRSPHDTKESMRELADRTNLSPEVVAEMNRRRAEHQPPPPAAIVDAVREWQEARKERDRHADATTGQELALAIEAMDAETAANIVLDALDIPALTKADATNRAEDAAIVDAAVEQDAYSGLHRTARANRLKIAIRASRHAKKGESDGL